MNDSICNTVSSGGNSTTTCYSVDPASSTMQYSLVQGQINALYYVGFSVDLLVIAVFIFLWVKVLTWRNRITDLWNK